MKTLNNVSFYVLLILCGVSMSSCSKEDTQQENTRISTELRSECSAYFEPSLGNCGIENVIKYNFKYDDDLTYLKIQGQILKIANDQYLVEAFGDHDMTLTVNELGNSGKINIKLEGSLDACTEATVKVTWTSQTSTGKITGNWHAKDACDNNILPKISPIFCN